MHLARFLHDMRSPEGSHGIKEGQFPWSSENLVRCISCEPHGTLWMKKERTISMANPMEAMNQNDWMHHIRWQFYGTLWRKSCLCASIFNAFFSGALCAHSSAKAPPLTAKPHPSGKLLTPAANSTPAANLHSSGKLPKLSILISTYKYLAWNLAKL